MKTVVVTGADGMLGSEVVRNLAKMSDVRVVPSTVHDTDITNLASVQSLMLTHRPTHVVHCAAFTAVDSAEKDRVTCYRVNSEGTKNLAIFAREVGADFLYISTDYVFPGDKGSEYVETDTPRPINVYGETKLLGEQHVQTLCESYKVVRTSWLNGLGGAYSRNFIETMLRIAQQRNVLSVVNDQVGRPTFTFDLAPAIVMLLDVRTSGIFHVTNEGSCTWYDLACKIFEKAGLRSVEVRPTTSDSFRSLAKRPPFSAMANTRFSQLGLPLLRSWEDGLDDYFRRRRQARSLHNPEELSPSPDAERV